MIDLILGEPFWSESDIDDYLSRLEYLSINVAGEGFRGMNKEDKSSLINSPIWVMIAIKRNLGGYYPTKSVDPWYTLSWTKEEAKMILMKNLEQTQLQLISHYIFRGPELRHLTRKSLKNISDTNTIFRAFLSANDGNMNGVSF